MGTALLLTETTTVQQHADNSEDNNYGTQRWQNLFIKRPLQDAVKCEGHELEALSRVELVLELHPAEKTEQQNNDWEVLQKNKNKKQTDALRWRLPGCVMLMVAVTSGLHATVCKHTHTHLQPLSFWTQLWRPRYLSFSSTGKWSGSIFKTAAAKWWLDDLFMELLQIPAIP